MQELINALKALKNINFDDAIAMLEKDNLDSEEMDQELAAERPEEELPPELMEDEEELYA